MIVVCGAPEGFRAGASASAVAAAAAATRAQVELVAVIADGESGDRQLLALAARGIGHRAVLRSAPRALDAADVDLALGYLPEVRVVVAVELAAATEAAAADRADWAAARLIVIRPGARGAAAAEGDGSVPVGEGIVLESPGPDPDGTFAGFVGRLAAELDAGATPADAWAVVAGALAVDAVGGR